MGSSLKGVAMVDTSQASLVSAHLAHFVPLLPTTYWFLHYINLFPWCSPTHTLSFKTTLIHFTDTKTFNCIPCPYHLQCQEYNNTSPLLLHSYKKQVSPTQLHNPPHPLLANQTHLLSSWLSSPIFMIAGVHSPSKSNAWQSWEDEAISYIFFTLFLTLPPFIALSTVCTSPPPMLT